MTEWRLLSSSIRMLDILAAYTRLFLLSVLCILCKYEKYTFIVGSGRQVAGSVLTLIPPWYRIIRPETDVSKIYFVDIGHRIVLYPPSLVLHLRRGVLAGDGVDG